MRPPQSHGIQVIDTFGMHIQADHMIMCDLGNLPAKILPP